MKRTKPKRKTAYTSPEKVKNGPKRRRVLLSQADTGKKWRYGQSTERLDG